jgi:predicted unusual protein kinase regulating ubiquinone biosynthesis (AarF/ABC1/UbiB family)
LLAAIEQGNEAGLARAREMNIDYRKVARRLLWVNYWAREENLFFHANPIPNNIIIGQDSKLYFINFSLTGNLSRTRKQAMRQNLYYAWQRDPQNMARALLILMEPLPPVDPIELTQKLETYSLQLVYALEADPYSLPWQERTSAVQWVGLVHLAHKYGISIDIEVLRLLRATLLVESIAVRLDRTIDFVREFRRFDRYKAEQARRRVTETVLDRLEGKSNEQLIIRMDRIFQTLEGLYSRIIHMFSLPSVNFTIMMSKWSYTAYTTVRFATQALVVTAIAVGLAVAGAALSGATPVDVRAAAAQAIASPYYHAVLLLLVFINARKILFRLDDKEV